MRQGGQVAAAWERFEAHYHTNVHVHVALAQGQVILVVRNIRRTRNKIIYHNQQSDWSYRYLSTLRHPSLKVSQDEISPFNLTAWVLLDKKQQIQGIIHGLMPKSINLRTRMVWLTLSNALEKSVAKRLVSTLKNVIHDFHQTMCCG